MITVYSGLPGSGKTAMLARKASELLKVNARIKADTGHVRPLYSNLPFTPLIVETYGDLIRNFSDIYTMPAWKDCDVCIDELSIYFDSHEWERLSKEIKRYLRLHRHYKVNIWAVAQDFLTVDKSFRRLVKHLYHVDNIFSYGAPTTYNPPKKHPIALSLCREVDPTMWEMEKEFYKFIPFSSSFEIFRKKDFAIFDTFADLDEQPLPPLRREVRHWYDENGQIGYTRKKYI